jgi:hypothetical protein
MTNQNITIEHKGKHINMSINDAINACRKHDDRKAQALWVDSIQHAAIAAKLATLGIDYVTVDMLDAAPVVAQKSFARPIHPARMAAAIDDNAGDINSLLNRFGNAACAK